MNDHTSESSIRLLFAEFFRRAILDWRLYRIAQRTKRELESKPADQRTRGENIKLKKALNTLETLADIPDWFAHNGDEPFTYLFCCNLIGVDGRAAREDPATLDAIAERLAQSTRCHTASCIEQTEELTLEQLFQDFDTHANRTLMQDITKRRALKPMRGTDRTNTPARVTWKSINAALRAKQAQHDCFGSLQ